MRCVGATCKPGLHRVQQAVVASLCIMQKPCFEACAVFLYDGSAQQQCCASGPQVRVGSMYHLPAIASK